MPAPKQGARAVGEPRSRYYDVWHGVSAGNQRGERTLPVVAGWRQSRSVKVTEEFKSDVVEGARKLPSGGKISKAKIPEKTPEGKISDQEQYAKISENEEGKTGQEITDPTPRRGIFDGLVIYVNGSTYPLISDYKLKQILVDNGAKLSLHLGRRQVTHVILGKPGTRGSGAGGGLAGSKLQREIQRVGGCGVKYISVEWVLESVRVGKRQAEAPFVELKIAAKGQPSVYGMFKKVGSASEV